MFRLPSRHKLAIAVALAMLAAIVSVTLTATSTLTQNMEEALGRQEYLRAQLVAQQLDGMLDARALALASLAESLPGPKGRTAAAMHDAMASQRALAGTFLNIALFDKSGGMVFSAQPPAPGGFVASTRPYFIEAVLNKRELLSQPFVSTFSGVPVVVMARPVFDAEGNVEYVLAASIPLDGGPLGNDPNDDERLYYVMTTDGYLVSHPQHARITHHANEAPELSPGSGIALQGFVGWRQIESAEKVYAFARLKRAPWIVGLQVSDAVAFRTAVSGHDRLVLTGTALAAIALLTAWLLTLLVRRPANVEGPRAPSDASEASGALASAAGAAPHTAPSAQSAAQPSACEPSSAPEAGTPSDLAAMQAAGASALATATLADGLVAPNAPPGPGAAGGRAADAVRTPTQRRERASATTLDLDAFMLQNFTTDEQRRSFISTVAASIRKLPAEAAAVGTDLQAAPGLLHTLKGAWGSLGATSFARAASELESAIKQGRPTDEALSTFAQEAAALQAQAHTWLLSREAATMTADAPTEELLPLLRERNINASSLYESNREYWDRQLGVQAEAFAAAMDALDFSAAERLLTDAEAEAAQRS